MGEDRIIKLPHNWDPRSYQVPLWQHMQGPEEGKRAVAVWHRRAGKDVLAINLIARKVFERPGMYWHLLPTYKQGRSIVWNGFTREGRKFLDHFPGEIVKERNKTEMRVEFINGGMYQVIGTDDVDSLVGTNPVGCVFSEYSLQDPGAWDYLRPILAENGGWALFIYTMRGKNHGYKMLEMSKRNPKWFSQVLVAGDKGTKRPDGTPVVSDAQIQDERDAGMPEEMIQQEFYCSAEAPLVGAYFGKQMSALDRLKQIGRVPWDSNLEVHTAWDLGIDDEMVLWFIQEYRHEIRVIDFVKRSDEGLNYFAKLLRGQVEGYERMGDFMYGKHYAPHDIEVRELSDGKSRREKAKDLGIKFTVVAKHDVEDGIEAVRSLLPNCWFDDDRCDNGIQALKSYRKEFDEKNKTFRSTPVHDWASHPADAFRTYAWGRKKHGMGKKQLQSKAVDEHNYMEI
jgi:phage terminase large subunit